MQNRNADVDLFLYLSWNRALIPTFRVIHSIDKHYDINRYPVITKTRWRLEFYDIGKKKQRRVVFRIHRFIEFLHASATNDCALYIVLSRFTFFLPQTHGYFWKSRQRRDERRHERTTNARTRIYTVVSYILTVDPVTLFFSLIFGINIEKGTEQKRFG